MKLFFRSNSYFFELKVMLLTLIECHNRLLVVTEGKDYGPVTKLLGTVSL